MITTKDIDEKIIYPITFELLDKIYNIIYLIRKIIVKKNICNNNFITIFYKIIDNYYNKIDDELNNLLKTNERDYMNYMIYYENAKLFLNTIKNIFIQLNNKYFYNDLYDAYYYYYNIINNNVKSDIYDRNHKLLEVLFNYLNNNINKDLVNKLNKIEINSYYYDLINSIEIKINIKKILKNFEIRNELIKSNITLQKNKKYNNEEIIKKKIKILEERNKDIKNCNLILTFEEPIIKKEKNNFKDLVFEITKNEDEISVFKSSINFEDENDDEYDNNDEIKIFKEELIKTFEENNNNFKISKENIEIIKNKFSNYYDNGKINIIKNYYNNSIASLFSNYISNNNKFIFSDNDRYSIINYNDEIRDYGVDLGNTRNIFIKSLIDELFEKKIFVNDEREDNNKYFLNSNYYPDETFYNIIKNNNKSYYDKIRKNDNDNEFIKDFYKFISNLITFLLFSNYNIQKELSSYLIANYYKKTFTDYDYIYYLFTDFNNYIKKVILKIINIDSEDLNSLNIEYNNEYLLDSNEETINSTNNINYIKNLAKFLTTKTIQKNIDKDAAIHRGELINKIFISAIPSDIIEEFNSIYNINNTIINKLFNNNDMSIDEFKNLFYNNIIFSIIKMKDENIIYKILNQKKIIIFANIIKSYFINDLLVLFKYKYNNNLKIIINKNLSISNTGKYYSNINNIEFPDYFINNNDDEINIIFNDFLTINEENSIAIREKYKEIIDKIETFFNTINPKKEIKGGKRRRNRNEYQLYVENKNCYFIIYNNKKHYLNNDNIMKKNKNLFMKIDKKYIKIIF